MKNLFSLFVTLCLTLGFISMAQAQTPDDRAQMEKDASRIHDALLQKMEKEITGEGECIPSSETEAEAVNSDSESEKTTMKRDASLIHGRLSGKMERAMQETPIKSSVEAEFDAKAKAAEAEFEADSKAEYEAFKKKSKAKYEAFKAQQEAEFKAFKAQQKAEYEAFKKE